jgi:S-adenosylmethionine:tRNA ribosyltransferase-isomerase
MQYISVSDYDYNLPEEKIAKYPLPSRDSSRLLVYNMGHLSDELFSNLYNHLPSGSLLVFNDTRVIQARLQFQKKTGSSIEIFCLEPIKPVDYYQAFQQKGSCEWKCLIGNIKKWKDEILKAECFINETKIVIEASKSEINIDWGIVHFKWQPAEYSFGEILENFGSMPIPPYLHRSSEEIDRTRYQTIYSMIDGSVAAPTAGLHFTPTVIEKLEIKNILFSNLTLHVGAGTFIPVKEKNAALHQMHSEPFIISKVLIQHLYDFNGNITATGTTSLRALESIYWIGVKLLENENDPLNIDQWEAYHLPGQHSTESVLKALLEYLSKNNLENIYARTRLMIIPGYKCKVVQRLITNFHQPKSTLLMLVSAFTGKANWMKIYGHALENDYRFLSYGDSSLLIR